jgi:hypothetical protein
MATWTSKYINSLPNSSFAWIDSKGGRHLPYKDANGKVDHNHTANALARLNQVQGMSDTERASVKAKLQKALAQTQASLDDEEKLTFSATAITLDSEGHVPTKFPLFVTGDWKNSVKGNFKVNLDHLKQMKENFDNGVGFPTEDASTGLAIDFAHNYADEAAGWIKGLELQIDPSDDTKATLYANPVEWTETGSQAIQSGKFKCVSPMGSFGEKNGKLSMWANPTNLKEKIANVIEGAGLTNIPFLRGMPPIRADRTGHLTQDFDNVIYVYDLEQKPKEPSMNLDELRVKERDALTVPELDFITEKKTELTKEELTKFKLDAEDEEEEEEEGNDADKLSDEEKQTLAAIKDGSKKVVDATTDTVEKDRLNRMESTIDKYRNEDVQRTLDKHVKRGAIKQDQAKLDGFWGKQLLEAANEDEEKTVKDALDALPANEQLANEIGTGEDVNAGSTAREQLDVLARERVDKAAKEGKELLYSDALKQLYREKEDLRNQDRQEQLTKAGA